MEARDQRALLKGQIATRGLPSLSLTLNIPGFPKSNSAAQNFFGYCVVDFRYFLKANLINILDEEAISGNDAAGDFFIVPCTPGSRALPEIKQFCETFEQNHPLGRFIDADLNDPKGNTVSSGKSKICFFCLERAAIDCRRENAHDPEEVRAFMFSKMVAYCNEKHEDEVVQKFSTLAFRAILSEISLTPKPGLVDKFSNGSHSDMNYQTFLDSTTAISPWFPELVREGFKFNDPDLTKVLPILRNIGLRMESAMFEATRNVNTQKGIIFLMGISLFACGRLLRTSDRFNRDEFRDVLRSICKDLVTKELKNRGVGAKSHGTDIFGKYGFSGARGEAESGFETVFRFGLPQLLKSDQLNDSLLIKCLLAIASANNDTNILYRSNLETLTDFQRLCKIALEDFNHRNYNAVIAFSKNNNISPGGSADLLAVTIFVWSVLRADLYWNDLL